MEDQRYRPTTLQNYGETVSLRQQHEGALLNQQIGAGRYPQVLVEGEAELDRPTSSKKAAKEDIQ